MPSPFYEDSDSPKRDPQAEGRVEFDWPGVYETFNEFVDDQPEQDRVVILHAMIDFVMKGIDLQHKNADRYMGRRFIALVWVVCPHLIPGSPSGRELARRIGMSHVTFARLTGEASKYFGITNGAQTHAWNRGKTITRAKKHATPPLSTIKQKQSVNANVSTQT